VYQPPSYPMYPPASSLHTGSFSSSEVRRVTFSLNFNAQSS
jgi:hypothetical protein